jgi:hypothetical protein
MKVVTGAGVDDVLRSPYDWGKEKQTFFDFNLNAGWKSQFMLRDNPLKYNVGLQYGHAVYDKSFSPVYKHGAHDNWGIITLGGSYDLSEFSTAALNIRGDYLRRGAKARVDQGQDIFDEAGLITLSPTYSIRGDMFQVQLGLNAHISFSDGPVFRLSPNVRASLALVDGFSVFANVLGSKGLGYRVITYYYDMRYDSPLLMYGSLYMPLDAEAGIKIGPFQGLSARVSLGYAIAKDQSGIRYRTPYAGHALYHGMMSTYMVMDNRGYYLNAEVNYKFRSLIEASAGIKYAPHDNELFASDTHYNGYKLGVDRASTVGNIDIKVTPWRPLAFNVGLDYRGGRMALFSDVQGENGTERFEFVKMRDAINLRAGANYRLNSSVSLWLQAHNLLNRRYDILYGMGAQRIGCMAGASFTF